MPFIGTYDSDFLALHSEKKYLRIREKRKYGELWIKTMTHSLSSHNNELYLTFH